MGKGRKIKTDFWKSATNNNKTYIQYYNRLMELAISMFEWINLPETIDERFLELCLFCYGTAVFFKDEDIDEYLALRCATMMPLDVYNVPTRYRAYADNGYQKLLNNKNAVLIYNNMLHTNSVLDCQMYAERLYNLDRVIDTNCNAQKTPILVRCDENERLSMENVYKEYDGNSPVIYGTKALNKDSLGVLTTGAPFVAGDIYTLKTQYWNEALTKLGISNVNFAKKERLISDEVLRNQGGTIASRYSRLNERIKACDKINKMFGLNIEVRYREDFRQTDDEFMVEDIDGKKVYTPMVEDIRTNSDINRLGSATKNE